jgi:hypothetical protein
LDHTQIFTGVFQWFFPKKSHGIATHFIGFLDFKNLVPEPCFGNFYDFSYYFRISCIVLNFMVVSLLFLNFYFYFLIEIGFMIYLRLWKPFNETDFIIIILEIINLWIWGSYLQPLSFIKNYMFFVYCYL